MTAEADMSAHDLANAVLELARAAGTAVMDIYRRAELDVTLKDDRSPLTEADLVSHRMLVAGLERIAPGVPTLSEEEQAIAYEVRRAWPRFWLIDPLDGTKEFLRRNGEFTINVALIEDGYPTLGVVHAPALDRSYWAYAPSSAFCEAAGASRALAVSRAADGVLQVVASRSHSSAETETFLQRVGAEHQTELVSIGSSLKLCLIAEGSAHLYPRFGPTMEWDTAAGQCVVEAAGGSVTDLDGRRLLYNKPDLHNPFFMAVGPRFDWRRYLS
jgi:3'(2'), 5'-bisphosphate nucleotidase